MRATNDILDEVLGERLKQDQKWGPQSHSLPEWVSILTEEVGETAEAVNDFHFGPRGGTSLQLQDHVRAELIQVAAVAVAMIEQIDNGQAQVVVRHS